MVPTLASGNNGPSQCRHKFEQDTKHYRLIEKVVDGRTDPLEETAPSML